MTVTAMPVTYSCHVPNRAIASVSVVIQALGERDRIDHRLGADHHGEHVGTGRGLAVRAEDADPFA